MSESIIEKKLHNFEEKLFKLEKELDLFNLKIYNIYFWLLLRVDIYYGYKFKSLNLEKNVNTSITFEEKIKKYFKTSNSAMAYNYTSDHIFIDRGKKSDFFGKQIDIFIEDIIKLSEEEGKDYLYIDMPYFNEYIEPRGKNVEGMNFFPRGENIFFNEQEINILNNIEERLFDITEVRYNLKNLLKNKIISFFKEYQYYKKLFLKRKPKKLFLTLSYRRYAIIAAAKDLGIEVIDVQYANITASHPGYSFPYNKEIKYFPDKLIVWGEYWKNITPIPLPDQDIIISAPSYYKQMRNLYENKPKTKITLISQPAFSDTFYEIACNLAERNKSFTFALRQHPGEIAKVYERKKPSNLYFSNYLNDDLHQLLSETVIQIGVSSTAVYEGLLYQCKTIILDLPTKAEMEHLIQNNIAVQSSLENINNIFSELLDDKEIYNVDHIFNFTDNIKNLIN